MNEIISGITNYMQSISIPHELIVFVISLLPILELRGGLIAAAILGMPFAVAFPICFVGNILPIPFVLLFFKKIIKWLTKLNNFIGRFARAIERRVLKKSKSLDRGKAVGLLLFVGIPLPGTGAWTGAAIASILEMRIKKSFPIIVIGVLMAGIIMSVITYLIPPLFAFLPFILLNNRYYI